MPSRPRLPLVVLVLSVALVVSARGGSGADAAVQFQLANLLFDETRYAEALEAYRKAAESDDTTISVPARIGLVRSALRIGEFTEAQREAQALRVMAPHNPEAMTVHADARVVGRRVR